MNILYIEQSLSPHLGGIEKVTNLVSNYLENQGHKCFFMFYKQDDDSILSENKLKFSLQGSYKDFLIHTIEFIEDKKIDVIIDQDCSHKYIRQLFEELKIQSKIKIVYCFHVSPSYWKFLKRRNGLSFLKEVIKRCFGINGYIQSVHMLNPYVDRFVLLSKSFIKDFSKMYGIDSDSITSIPNPLPSTKVEPLSIEEKENTILIVSRFYECQKNLKAALRIWKLIDANVDGWNLKIVGYGEDEQSLKDYASELALKNVSFEGRSYMPSEYYRNAKIFIMTSHFEGFGMTLIEAQQQGCVPIAFNNFSVLQDIIEDGNNGLVIPPNNENLFATKCCKLMRNKIELKRMSDNARNSCLNFEIDRIGQMWNLLLNHI